MSAETVANFYACQATPNGSKPVSMKKKSLSIALTLGICSFVCAFFDCEKTHPKPLAGSEGLRIEPTATHPEFEDKWAKIQQTLETYPYKHRKELFHIRKYKRGEKPIDEPSDGALQDMFLAKEIADYDAEAKKNGFEGHAIQIGLAIPDPPDDSRTLDSAGKQRQSYASASPETGGPQVASDTQGTRMPHPHLSLNINESKKLTDKVNDILNH